MRSTKVFHRGKVRKIQFGGSNINRPPGLPCRRAGIGCGLQRFSAARVMGK
jgi:hypothetical protein